MSPLQREILVIDGDEGTRALMGQILAEQGFAVTAVAGNAYRWAHPAIEHRFRHFCACS
jgi:DNA-binding NtrC family response regulator